MNPSKSTQTPCDQSKQFDIVRKEIAEFRPNISDAALDFVQKLYTSTETLVSQISWTTLQFKVETVSHHLWVECNERWGDVTCLYVRSGCATSLDPPRTAGARGESAYAQISSLLRLHAFPFFEKNVHGHVWGEKNQIVIGVEWTLDSTIENLLKLCDSALAFAANESIPKILLAADFEKNKDGRWVEGETRKRKGSFEFMKLFIAVQNNNVTLASASANALLLLNICEVVPVDILRAVSKLIC